MPVQVASICPIERKMYHIRFLPRKFWVTPPVKRGEKPVVIQFNDDIIEVGNYKAFGVYSDGDHIAADVVADDFIYQNWDPPFARPPLVMPGIWKVGSLGQNEEYVITGAGNANVTILQLDRPHKLKSPQAVTVSGCTNYWGVLNGSYVASPVSDKQLSIPINSTPFGDFISGGSDGRLTISRQLSIDEEADIMRPRQEAWLDRLVQNAKMLWAKEQSMTHIMGWHHIAAEYFDIQGEPWQQKNTTENTVQCRYCGTWVPHRPLCNKCDRVLDPDWVARLEFDEAQAKRAESKRRADLDKEKYAKIREENAAAAKETVEA